jgi:hypothetical protein
VVGSAKIFADGYLEKEENEKVFDVFLNLCITGTLISLFLLKDKISLNIIDANEPDVCFLKFNLNRWLIIITFRTQSNFRNL